jgi:hypothetical protein
MRHLEVIITAAIFLGIGTVLGHITSQNIFEKDKISLVKQYNADCSQKLEEIKTVNFLLDFNNYCDLAKAIIRRSDPNPDELAKKNVLLGAIRTSLFWKSDFQRVTAYREELFSFNSEKTVDSGHYIKSKERLDSGYYSLLGKKICEIFEIAAPNKHEILEKMFFMTENNIADRKEYLSGVVLAFLEENKPK